MAKSNISKTMDKGLSALHLHLKLLKLYLDIKDWKRAFDSITKASSSQAAIHNDHVSA